MAARRIVKWQKKTLGFEHCLVWSDMKELRPETMREGSPPCPLCMAFSFWCCAITLKFTNSERGGSPDEHQLCRLTHYRRYPNIPAGVFIENHRGSAYRPSANFERWLFLNASDYAFLELVQLALWIFERTADESVRYSRMGYLDDSHTFRQARLTSQIMEVRLQKDQLTALYWPASPLLDIDLSPEALYRVKHCTVDSGYAHDFNYALESDPRKVNQLLIIQLLKDPQRPHRALFPWLAHTFNVYPHATSAMYDFEVVRGLANYDDIERYWSMHDLGGEMSLVGTGNQNTTNGALQLAVRRLNQKWPTCGCSDDSGSVYQIVWTRTV